MDVATNARTNITSTADQWPSERYPTWSSADVIAFADFANGGIDTVKPDGTNRTKISTGAGDQYAVWSPQGDRIAYLSMVHGPLELHVMNADGSGQTRLSQLSAGEYDWDPRWSPDGKYILISSQRGGNEDIYRVDAATGTTDQLTSTAGPESRPSWRP